MLTNKQRVLQRKPSKSVVIIEGDGIPCPRCKQPTEIREHKAILPKHLKQPYYFTRWFFCRNPDCVVSIHMSEQYKVFNAPNPQC